MSEKREKWGRREFLKTAGRTIAGTLLTAGGLRSIAAQSAHQESPDDLDQYDFLLPRVRFVHEEREVDRWNVRPGGDANLLRELSSVIRCKVKPVEGTDNWEPQYAEEGQLNAVVTLDEPKRLKKYPFLFMTGENHYEINEQQKENLSNYISRGGFLLMDDCVVGSGGDFFYKSSYKLLEEVFGPGAVKRIPHSHEVFHNVYNLGDVGLPFLEFENPPASARTDRQDRAGLPYMHGQNYGARGVFVGDRLAVFLSSTDIHCGWTDGQGRTFRNHKQAIQMGINIIMYAISH